MKAKKKIGIWMDYANACIFENASGEYLMTFLESDPALPVNGDSKQHSENVLHNKENQTEKSYFKALIEQIKGYDEVLLFGPTKAKTALYNQIKAMPKFNKIYVETREADKMSHHQMKVFIKDYFSKLLHYDSNYTN